jgi:hypothetical protein
VALQSLKDLGRLTYRRFFELFRQMVGLLGRVISPSQGLYLHRTTQHRKTRDKHPCLEWDSNPQSQQPTGQGPRLRPHGHCDRPLICYCPSRVLTLHFVTTVRWACIQLNMHEHRLYLRPAHTMPNRTEFPDCGAYTSTSAFEHFASCQQWTQCM